MTKNQKAKLDKVMQGEIKDLKRHFRSDKWDLDYTQIRSDIVRGLLGYEIDTYIMRNILASNRNLKLKYGDGKIMITHKNYRPVYYNTETNELLVLETIQERLKFNKKELLTHKYVEIGQL